MSSRRLMTRSNSGEGRSSSNNGDEANGTSRPGGRSYLSNVRPENRSTLCSVMAQLTEETQPLFETTLKSKAVSETCNMKFTCVVTGHPTPEITWYKDDMQLDRYCGLPKYEIFRNGQNHSLHIYNCTVDDAAIYQASAANTKGIVSCSGVLEVGVMSEYKIHQRYFDKIKQKAENKRRELEGKVNQGPGDQLRTISPDRSQRKRRSPMEASFSASSSMEDEGTEENREGLAAEVEARLQETAMGQVEEKPVPITNGQDVTENGNKGLYVYDSTQNSFIAHQPKTPFAKKKIKISNGVESVNADTLAGMVSEERGAPAPTQSEEVMEVENTVYPSAVPSNHIKVAENCQKAVTEKALLVKNMAVATEKTHMKGNVVVPLHKEQSVVQIPPVPKSSTVHKETPVVPITPVPKSSTVHKETPVVPITPVPKSSTVHKETPVVPITPVPKSSTVHKETSVVPIPPVPKCSTVHKETPVVPITPVPKSSTVHKETSVVPITPVPKSSTVHKETPVVPITPVPKCSTVHKETPVVPITPVPKSPTVHKETPVVPITPVPKCSTVHKEQSVVPIPPVPKCSTVHKETPVVPIPPVPKSSTVHKETPVVPITPVPKCSTVHKEQSVVPITPVPKLSTVHKEVSTVPITPVPKSSTVHKEAPVVPIPPVPKSSTVHKDQSVVPITPVPKSSTVHKEAPVVPITPVPKSSTVHKEAPVVPITPVPKSSTVHKETPVVPITPVPKSSTVHKEQSVVPITPVPKSPTVHKEQSVVPITPVPKSSTVHKEMSTVPITPVPKSSTVHKETPVVPITPVPKSSTVHKEQSVVPITPVPKSPTVHTETPVVPITPVPKSSTVHKETPVVPITPVPKSSTVHKETPVVPITPVPKCSTVHKEQSVVPITPVPKCSTVHKEMSTVPIPPVPKSSTVHKEHSVVPITPVPKCSTVHKEQSVVPITPVPKCSTVHKETPVVPITPVPKCSTVHKEVSTVPIPPVPKFSTVHKEVSTVPIPPVPKSSTVHKEQSVVPITPVATCSTVHKETPVVPIPPVLKSSTVHMETPVVLITPVPKSSTVHMDTPVVPIPPVPKSSTVHKEAPVVPITHVPKSSTVHKEMSTVPIPHVPKSSTVHKDLNVGHNEKVENHKVQSPNPTIVSSRLLLSPVVTTADPSNSTVREDVSKTQQEEDVTVMDVDEKPLAAAEPQRQTATPLLGQAVSNTAEDSATVGPQSSNTSIREAPVCVIGSMSEESPRIIQDALPGGPREPFGHQQSEEETSPRNASASQPPQLGEVTQPCTQAKRNDAPVKRQPPPTHCELDLQSPRRPPSGKEAMVDGGQTPTLHNSNQSAADAMTQSTGDHSRGSNDSHAVLFRDLQKSPLERQSDGKNTMRCSVSPAVQQSHIEIAIKTVEETEIQVDKKVEEGRLKVHRDNLACTERRDEVENQVESQNRSEQVEIERTTDAGEKEVIGMTVMDVSYNEMEKNVPVLKRAEEISAHPKSLKHLKPTEPETVVPVITTNREKANSKNTNMSGQQIETFKEIPTPVSNIMSIAEIMRSQLKAIGAEPLTAKSQTPVDSAPCSATTKAQQTSEKSPEIRTDHPECRLDPEKPPLGGEMEARVYESPRSNIEAKEHKLVHSPNAGTVTVTAEHRPMLSLCVGTTIIDALQKPFVIPPISVIDVGNPLETKAISSSTVKDNDSVMDTGQESGASPPVPLKDNTSASLSGTEHVQIELSPIRQKEEPTSAAPPTSNPPVTSPPEPNQSLASTVVENDSGHSLQAMVSTKQGIDSSVIDHGNEKHVQSGDLIFTPCLNPEMQLISEAHASCTQPGSAALLDQHKDTKPMIGGAQTMQRLGTESALGPETQGINTPLNQREDSPSTIEDDLNSDSFTPLMDAESNPLLGKGNGAVASIPAATPRELASGARRKIFIPKPTGESSETTSPVDTQPPREEGVVSKTSNKVSQSPSTPSASPNLSRRLPLLQPPSGQQTPPAEKRSPLLSRKKVALETPPPSQESPEAIEETPKTEDKPAKDKHDPFKAPQVIRKIRGEPFSDALGHLKLWCQFFNVLSDSTIKWYRDEVEIAEVIRSAGDETQVALAIVQASSRDCGVYGCTIANDYGTDSTDILLSVDILSGMFLREDLEVGEEIEMTPLLFNKGLADSGVWGNKFFGRVMIKESHVGEGSSHKAWRAKVIYGLEPVFESGNTCIIKVCNPIAYGGKEESNLVERNLIITQQECRLQNLAREYCKVFSAEARLIENFGESLEVIPVYMMYRPASTIPHATVEGDLNGVYLKYCLQDAAGRLVMRTSSKVEQKCCALQHWVHQWTNGNLLLTRLEGVDTKITNVGISIKSTGYQGLSAAAGNPKLFEQFVSQHQCNYYCGLLSLRSLKTMDSLQTPSKAKSSRSPLLHRKTPSGSSSPQTGRKAASSPLLHRKTPSGSSSPQTGRKAASSPRSPRKSEPEPAGGKALATPTAVADTPKVD